MKQIVGIGIGIGILIFVAAAGWQIGGMLSTDALGMALGVIFGMMAGIPAALIALSASRQPQPQLQPQPPPQPTRIDVYHHLPDARPPVLIQHAPQYWIVKEPGAVHGKLEVR
jgi:hypothetical protein